MAKSLPESPGVYLYYFRNTVIYVGKAVNLKNRVLSYFDLDLEPKTALMVSEAESLAYIRVTSELEALLLEAKLIRKFMPQYNIAAKDDKHPLYIIITKEKYPRVITARKIDTKTTPNIAWHGPFPSSGNVKLVLRMIRRIVPFSDHKLGKRKCIYSHIGLCRPCPSEIENLADEKRRKLYTDEYKKNIRKIKSILDGKFEGLKKNLTRDMDDFSRSQEYESAREVRDQIKRLEYITSPQIPTDIFMENPNLYQDLRQKEMSELQKLLEKYLVIPLPQRIECFDIAHLAGASATASMVTFVGAESDKKLYRHFRIRQKKGDSDVDSLKEVIKRRLNHLDDWGRPDLIIVDGGKPQVGVFVKELENSKVPCIGLAKREETFVIPIKNLEETTFTELRVPRGPVLNLVQRMRDEAHRFARRYHHKLVSRALVPKK